MRYVIVEQSENQHVRLKRLPAARAQAKRGERVYRWVPQGWLRKEAEIKTMAVGLILTPQQAEEIAAKADLVAIGREALYDPNWPLHAALALGVDPEFARWPVQYGWWLTRRESLLRKAGVKR